MARLTYQQALVEGIREEMTRDDSVFLLGQDIGHFGGPLQSTKGLWEEFGESGRIIDSSIAETAMAGLCVGAALKGMRPVLEIMFSEFLTLVMQPIASDAASIHYLSAGKARVPLVLRTKYGISPHPAHKQDFHSWFAGIPGLTVVMPATPYDAKGLMKSAIRDDNPVIFFEQMHLYHGIREEVPEENYTVPLGVADVKREGTDVTVVAYGLMVGRALDAASILESEGISVEVVDLRTVHPFDEETVLASVRKTGRLVIAHEARKTGGTGGEIAALVAEKAFSDLKAPILRVGAADVPIPASKVLEGMVIPDKDDIAASVRSLLATQT
jgi:pyruvate/2-oxoglutarate/acetoin dehydrogenase E1 component